MQYGTLSPAAQPAPDLPKAGSLDPPMVGLYAVIGAESLACARAMRGRRDALALYSCLERAHFKSRAHRRLLERVAFYYSAPDCGGPEELLAELRRHGSSMTTLATRLATVPNWLLDAAGSAAEIAAAVVYGPHAFRAPHARRSTAA